MIAREMEQLNYFQTQTPTLKCASTSAHKASTFKTLLEIELVYQLAKALILSITLQKCA